MQKFFIHYDENKREILGSDGFSYADGRQTLENALDTLRNNNSIIDKVKRGYVRQATGRITNEHGPLIKL